MGLPCSFAPKARTQAFHSACACRGSWQNCIHGSVRKKPSPTFSGVFPPSLLVYQKEKRQFWPCKTLSILLLLPLHTNIFTFFGFIMCLLHPVTCLGTLLITMALLVQRSGHLNLICVSILKFLFVITITEV